MRDNDTSVSSRIDAIERNFQKLRRDTGRMSAMTARNREDIDHVLADIDELLYAALATGHEITVGDARPEAAAPAADPPRCTHPTHEADPPDARPVATHLITLRAPRSGNGEAHPPLPRCADCAAAALKSASASRIAVRSIDGDGPQAGAPRCQSPVHLASELPPATTVIVTAGTRPGIRYCDACAETNTATLKRHKVPFETATIVPRRPAASQPGAGRR